MKPTAAQASLRFEISQKNGRDTFRFPLLLWGLSSGRIQTVGSFSPEELSSEHVNMDENMPDIYLGNSTFLAPDMFYHWRDEEKLVEVFSPDQQT
ncbi:hypothetical protein VTN31DRAFT_3902 [Thermomyces dupontii]|uniref:uncharacterized protein n=1 Tax=Talaromyces thermophilus TaxID=28565 RepID=UPI00374441A3